MKRTHSTVVGHPVDVATGVVYSAQTDLAVPGEIPLRWTRHYSTARLGATQTPLGTGWTASFWATLSVDGSLFTFVSPEGDEYAFSDPDETLASGGLIRHLSSYQELFRRDEHFVVRRWDVRGGEYTCLVFSGRSMALRAVENQTGAALDLQYDRSGQLIRVTQRREQRSLALVYLSTGFLGSVTAMTGDQRAGATVGYDYDTEGRLLATHESLGSGDRYDYHPGGQLRREVTAAGGVYDFEYDSTGRCVWTSGTGHFDAKTLRYFDAIGWTEVIDSVGGVTRYRRNPAGQITSEVDAAGGVMHREFDLHGRLAAEVDGVGGRTEYRYDERGNRSTLTRPTGQTFSMQFTDDHLLTEILDPAGNVWRREYDARRRITLVEEPLGRRWRIAYHDATGEIETTLPDGTTVQQRLDRSGQVVSEEIDGGVATYSIDPFGRITAQRGPGAVDIAVEYDFMGRAVSVRQNGAEVRTAYDGASQRLAMVTDAAGASTAYKHDAYGRLRQILRPDGSFVEYEWSTEPRRLSALTNERQQRYRFEYDLAGRVVREIGFDGRALTYQYDAAGRCTALVTGAGERIVFTLDPAGRVIEERLPDGTVSTFAYDWRGQIVACQRGDIALGLSRDALGRVVGEDQNGVSVEISYDHNDRPVALRTSLGADARFGYDRAGLSEASIGGNPILSLREQTPDRRRYSVLGDRLRLEESIDAFGRIREQRLTRSADTDNRALISRRFEFDRAERIVGIDAPRLESPRRFAYTPSGLVARATDRNGKVSAFAYDDAGKLVGITHDGHVEDLVYERGGRLAASGSTAFVYDGHGRLIQRGDRDGRVWAFTWDATSRLTSLVTPEGAVWRYTYDALGRRVEKTDGATTIQYVWDGNVVVHEIVNGSPRTWLFHPLSFQPLCTIQSGNTGFVVCDYLGTPAEIVTADGSLVEVGPTGVWGDVRSTTADVWACPVGLQGQWADDESGFCYTKYRYYDPRTGRFVTQDPLGLTDELDLYRYGPDPLNDIDPLGLGKIGDWFKALVIGAAVIIAPQNPIVKVVVKDLQTQETRRRRDEEQENERNRAGNKKKTPGGPPDDEEEKKPGC